MWIAKNWKDYQVIDCSQGAKLERWGKYLLVRPGTRRSSGIHRKQKKDGTNLMLITIEVKKAAVNGNFLICRSSEPFIIMSLPLT